MSKSDLITIPGRHHPQIGGGSQQQIQRGKYFKFNRYKFKVQGILVLRLSLLRDDDFGLKGVTGILVELFYS